MTRNFKKILFLGIVSLISFSSLHAFNPDNYLDFTAGYRNDTFHTRVDSIDASGATIGEDTINIKGFTTFDTNLQGKYTFCRSFYVRGFGGFGWPVGSAEYIEPFSEAGVSGTVKGRVHTGTTVDFTGGFGYLFNLSKAFKIGAIGGYSYNFERIRLSNVTLDGADELLLDALTYKNRWQGPWIGLDLIFDGEFLCKEFDFIWTAGYEYHWPDWRASWVFHQPDVFDGSFSDKRSSNDASGHVGHLNVRWNFYNCWNIGMTFKVQSFRAHNGTLKPLHGSFADVSSTVVSGTVKYATWQSASATIDLGWTF